MLRKCLEAVFRQRCEASFDVVVLDSGSRDQTVRIARSYPAEVLTIPAEMFGFSKTLNFGAHRATSTHFVILSAHSVPADDHWLGELLAPFQRNDTVAAAYSRQISWPTESGREVEGNRHIFSHEDYVLTPSEYLKQLHDNQEPYEVGKFSNSSSCFRREVLLRLPFRALPYSEDRAAAVDCLVAGHAVAYAARSIVYHGHEPRYRDFKEQHRRSTIARFHINRYAHSAAGIDENIAIRFQALRCAAGILLRVIFCWPYVAYRCFDTLVSYRRFNRGRELRFNMSAAGTSTGALTGLLELWSGHRDVMAPAGFADISATVIQENREGPVGKS
jgi:glycosyltransferase involved in cell wall biosynthesis